MEKRILTDEKLQPNKSYRYFFKKVYIPNVKNFELQAQQILNNLKYKYSCSMKIRIEWVGEVAAEFSIFVIFYQSYNETAFGFLQKIKEEMLAQNWLVEAPIEIYDPINPIEEAPDKPSTGTIENVIASVKAFYQENKGLCLLAAGAFAFLLLMIALSRGGEE